MATGAAPLVSVVIPARNAAAFIGEAVRSVLRQTYDRLECVVVDDGSTDETRSVLARIADGRLAVHRRRGPGSAAAARNFGVARSSGTLIAFLDADDVWHPEKLARQVDLFRRSPRLAVSWCGYVITRADLSPIAEVRPRRRFMDLQSCLLLESNGVALSSTGMVSREAFEAEAGFDQTFSVSADLDFAERVVRRHTADVIGDVLVAYRTHPGQMHLDLAAFEQDARWLLSTRDLPTALRRRGLANLETRLFFHKVRHDPRGAVGHLRRLGRRVDRPVLLPLEAVARRAARLAHRARFGVTDPRGWAS